MGGIRRGVAVAAAFLPGAAPAMAGTGISNISVRRRANLTSVAVHAVVPGGDDSSAGLGPSRERDEAARWASQRRSRPTSATLSPAGHMEVSRT
jgi:hypothetical protein